MTPEEILWTKRFYQYVIGINLVLMSSWCAMIVFAHTWPSWEILSEFNWTTSGVMLLLMQLIYTLASIKSVKLDRQAILEFFGHFVCYVDSGIVYVPYLLCTLIDAPKTMIERDLPADPRKIYHGDPKDGDGKIPPGFFPPIRVTFASPLTKGLDNPFRGNKNVVIPKDDPYNQRQTAEVEMSYGWKIFDLRRLYETIGTIDKAISQMDDMAIGTFTDIFSGMTPAEALMHLDGVGNEVKKQLSTLARPWGIEIPVARMKPFGFSHDLNAAVVNVPIAQQRKKAAIITSEGSRDALTNVGVGKANMEYDLLSARADAEGELAIVAGTPGGQFAMAMQATQRGLETSRAVIVPQDNLFGAAVGISELIKKFPTNTPPAIVPPAPQSSGQGAQVSNTPQAPQQPRKPRYGGKGRKGRDKK